MALGDSLGDNELGDTKTALGVSAANEAEVSGKWRLSVWEGYCMLTTMLEQTTGTRGISMMINHTDVKLFMISKVQWVFCLEISPRG